MDSCYWELLSINIFYKQRIIIIVNIFWYVLRQILIVTMIAVLHYLPKKIVYQVFYLKNLFVFLDLIEPFNLIWLILLFFTLIIYSWGLICLINEVSLRIKYSRYWFEKKKILVYNNTFVQKAVWLWAT
jgi:hypothetical protein